MRLFFYIFIILLTGCKEPEARRPLNVKTTTLFDESVERNKKMLALEETTIKNIMEKDTINTYYASAGGFWYYYHIRDSINSYAPGKDDIVLINYDIRTLAGKPIYTKDQIGNINLKIDSEILFPGLNKGLKLMKKGETITFLFPSYLAYGYHGDDHKIGINTPVISTVSLIDILEKTNNNTPN